MRGRHCIGPARACVLRGAMLCAVQRALIVIGGVILAVGLLWPWLTKLGLGRLPGDIRIVRDGFTFYFPIVTCLLVSIAVSVILWFLRK